MMQSISHRKTSVNAYKLQCNYTFLCVSTIILHLVLYIQSSHWSQAFIFLICHYDTVLLHFTLNSGQYQEDRVLSCFQAENEFIYSVTCRQHQCSLWKRKLSAQYIELIIKSFFFSNLFIQQTKAHRYLRLIESFVAVSLYSFGQFLYF